MINKIALLKPVQSFIRKTENSVFYEKVNRKLPQLETVVATACYVGAIQQNKRIEKERKPAMQYQAIIAGVAGILLSNKVSRFTNKHKDLLCKELQHKNIVKVNNIIKGVNVAMPLVVTSFFLRFLIPIISVPISTWINNKRKSNNS